MRLCALYGSHNKRWLLLCASLIDWFCVTKVESVYCMVYTKSLYGIDLFCLQKVNGAVSNKAYINNYMQHA